MTDRLTRLTLIGLGGVEGELTIEHARSSHGLPVLVIDGRVYGPQDRLDEDDGGMRAATWVADAYARPADVRPEGDGPSLGEPCPFLRDTLPATEEHNERVWTAVRRLLSTWDGQVADGR